MEDKPLTGPKQDNLADWPTDLREARGCCSATRWPRNAVYARQAYASYD